MDFISLILTCSPAIHPETMYALVKTESSFNPIAIAVPEKLVKQPSSKEEAIQLINDLEKDNQNYSVGIAQINKVNFSRFGVTGEQLLDPCKNLEISQKILSECYSNAPSQKVGEALSCYYSGNFKYGYQEEPKLNSSYVQRVAANYKSEDQILNVPSIENEINEMRRVQKKSTKKVIKSLSSLSKVSSKNSKLIFKN